jgi:hypothetical protein
MEIIKLCTLFCFLFPFFNEFFFFFADQNLIFLCFLFCSGQTASYGVGVSPGYTQTTMQAPSFQSFPGSVESQQQQIVSQLLTKVCEQFKSTFNPNEISDMIGKRMEGLQGQMSKLERGVAGVQRNVYEMRQNT